MIDHLVGNPSPSWRRAQVFLVIIFWVWRIIAGNPTGPSNRFRRLNDYISRKMTPWQVVTSTLTAVYALRNFDKILGLPAPEPLAGVYSPAFYRATWITTGLDAGFATAMSIRPKWFRDICSVLFSVYYIIYAHEADEKLRKFRAVPTADMLRVTWEKTTNPYIRKFLKIPPITTRRKILLPRPEGSKYKRPITAWLFFPGSTSDLQETRELILDYPGGGFISMTPEHHEERLRIWALRTGRPVLSIDYGKGPEYPFPFAIDECFDVYRILVNSSGLAIGMSGRSLNIIMSGDSAGATMAINVVFKILEYNLSLHAPNATHIPLPIALLFNYPFLDFNFTSWMSTDQKDHLNHIDPANMIGDKGPGYARGKLRRRRSWRDALRGLASGDGRGEEDPVPPIIKTRHSTSHIKVAKSSMKHKQAESLPANVKLEDQGGLADGESDTEEESVSMLPEGKGHRVRFSSPERASPVKSVVVEPLPLRRTASVLEKRQTELSAAIAEADNRAALAVGGGKDGVKGKEAQSIETRLTMTSRTAYFQDRVVSPSMMRAMALLWIGPHRNPDFATDYHLSPILAPSHLLAQLPPCLLQCGEKDPFVDDTIVFAGRIKEAKRARLAELENLIAKKGVRVSEGLRMTNASEAPSSIHEVRLPAYMKERDLLERQTEEDWVRMVLFSDWSHGYLQMLSLMKEAMSVVEELADWINEAFEKYSPEAVAASLADDEPTTTSLVSSETETDDAGITFIPRRVMARRASQGQGSDELLESSPPRHSRGIENGYASPQTDSTPFTPPMTPTGKTAPRLTGQKITETELMRRRRMIDSNIFGQ